jgi:hypothetical protein
MVAVNPSIKIIYNLINTIAEIATTSISANVLRMNSEF